MAEKFGGFWTTGIWVMLKYAVPVFALAGAMLYFSPSSRVQVAATLHGTLGQVVDLSNVPGMGGSAPAAYPPIGGQSAQPPAGGFWFRTFGIGKPVIDETTPRVRLADLPGSGVPQTVRLSELPQPTTSISYAIGSDRDRRAPGVHRSPRPHRVPSDLGSLPPQMDVPRGLGFQFTTVMGRLGIPVAP